MSSLINLTENSHKRIRKNVHSNAVNQSNKETHDNEGKKKNDIYEVIAKTLQDRFEDEVSNEKLEELKKKLTITDSSSFDKSCGDNQLKNDISTIKNLITVGW